MSFFSFIQNMAPFMMDAAPWEWDYAPGYTPEAKPHAVPPGQGAPVAVNAPAGEAVKQASGIS
jgi:hypothetical protein